jgi:AcrR family transcriptional regulator
MPRPAPTADRTTLSKERVIGAAVELADREGLEAVTMRRLAQELGAGAMSLYYYVPNKDELIDGMVDVVFAEIELPTIGGDWQAAMRQRAFDTREALRRHRWAVGVMESRVAKPGPANVRLHNAVLGCLREAGFSIPDAIHAYSVQDAYIYGFAQQEQSVPTADEMPDVVEQQAQHIDDDPSFGELAEQFPHIAEVVMGHLATHGYDFSQEFAYGLDLILEALERRRRGG